MRPMRSPCFTVCALSGEGVPALHSVVAKRRVSRQRNSVLGGPVDLRAEGRTARNLRGSKDFAKRARSASETVEGREGGSRAAGGCAVVLQSCLGATRAYARCWRGGRGSSSQVARGLLEGAPSCSGTAGERRAVGAEGVGAARKSLAWQHLRGNICGRAILWWLQD